MACENNAHEDPGVVVGLEMGELTALGAGAARSFDLEKGGQCLLETSAVMISPACPSLALSCLSFCQRKAPYPNKAGAARQSKTLNKKKMQKDETQGQANQDDTHITVDRAFPHFYYP